MPRHRRGHKYGGSSYGSGFGSTMTIPPPLSSVDIPNNSTTPLQTRPYGAPPDPKTANLYRLRETNHPFLKDVVIPPCCADCDLAWRYSIQNMVGTHVYHVDGDDLTQIYIRDEDLPNAATTVSTWLCSRHPGQVIDVITVTPLFRQQRNATEPTEYRGETQ